MSARADLVVAVAVALALAGCFGGGPAVDPATNGTDGSPEATTAATPTALPDPGPGPHTGRGESVSTTATGTPEDVVYFSENDTIRYVAAWRHTNHEAVVERDAPPEREPVYEYTPFADWADNHAASVGARAVRSAVSRRLGAVDPGLSTGFGTRDDDPVVIVQRATVRDREGSVVAEANVSYARLVAVAPRNVTVSLTVEDRSYERTYPVRAENVTMQEA